MILLQLVLLLAACADPTATDSGIDGGTDGGDGGGSDGGDGGGSDGGDSGHSEEITLPAGPWVEVAVGGYHACALRGDGELACWGEDGDGQASPPDGRWSQVSAGLTHSCALDLDGAIHCWGNDGSGQASPPGGSGFTSISAGMGHSCAIDSDSRVHCWGADLEGQASPPDALLGVQVSAGGTFSISVDAAGLATCWGSELYCFNKPIAETSAVSAGFQHVAVHRWSGTVACAGFQGEGRCPGPDEVVDRFDAGGYHSCGLVDDAVRCWPQKSLSGEQQIPAGEFIAVSAGQLSSCAVALDGELACWSADGSWVLP